MNETETEDNTEAEERKEGWKMPAMRTILAGESSRESPVNGLPLSAHTSTPPRLSGGYTHTQRSRDHREAVVDGSINNSLAEPSISPRRYDRPVDHLCDYTRSLS